MPLRFVGKEVMMQSMKSNLQKQASMYFWITIASLLYALAFDWFYVPNHIGFGGITGVGQVVNAYLPVIPVGTFVLIINIPLFILGWKYIGGHLLVSSLYAMVVSSIAVDVIAIIPFEPMDEMLATICGGALMGLSLGIIFIKGATTGGTDLIARLVKLKLPWAPMGKLLLVIDLAVILLVAVAFRQINTALYGVIAQVVSAYVTDTVLYGMDNAKVAYIITNHEEDVLHALVNHLERGVTILNGEGAFSRSKKNVLMCAFKQREIVQLKELVFTIDEDAFIIVCNAHEVTGKGFKTYQKNEI